MENSAEFYYEKLKNDDKPGVVLATFYCTLYGKDVTRSEIILFNKLTKTFSRFMVYFSILDAYGSKPDGLEEPYGYLYTICKRRFEAIHADSTIQSRESLEPLLKSITREIEEIEKMKSRNKYTVPSSEGLESDG